MKTNTVGMHSYFMEATGAFFLVLVFGFTGNALAIGITLMALVYIGFDISGAHYNPAVSFAFFLKRELSPLSFTAYLISQLSGAFLAALAIYFLSGSVFYIEPSSTTDLYQQVFAELIFTLLFVLVMLTLSISRSMGRNNFGSIIVGLTFAGMLIVSTPVSGGILNPATFIGVSGFDLLMGGDSIKNILLYTLSPLAAAGMAAFIFTYLQQESAS